MGHEEFNEVWEKQFNAAQNQYILVKIIIWVFYQYAVKNQKPFYPKKEYWCILSSGLVITDGAIIFYPSISDILPTFPNNTFIRSNKTGC